MAKPRIRLFMSRSRLWVYGYVVYRGLDDDFLRKVWSRFPCDCFVNQETGKVTITNHCRV